MTARFVGRALCLLLVAGSVSGGCTSGGSGSKITFLAAGQLLPSERPSGNAARVAAEMATTTIPLAKQNPLTALFQSMSVFQSCLQGLGSSFIGVPDGKDPNSPVNDPTYIKNLKTCAAQSQILQALKDISNAENKLTPAQIVKQNKQYLSWRLCMIGRGWQIPMPTPDSNGRLFDINSSSGSQMVPPPGQSVLSSGDMEACANKIAPAGSSNNGGQ